MQSNEISDTKLAAMIDEQKRWLGEAPTAVKVHSTHLYSDVLKSFREANEAHRTDMLEALVDASNIKSVLSRLATVCDDKSAHVAENWQDHKLASRWASASLRLTKLANALPNDAGIGYGD